jgi:CRISPR-associated protein Cmr4
MKANLYVVTAQTNLHAGSGDTDYSVIDKLVQRDALTGLPCVYSQSMKGSIREYFEHIFDNGDGAKTFMDTIFGKTNKEGGKTMLGKDKSKSGEYVFLQANLLSLPVRSDNRPFYRVTSLSILKDLHDLLLSVGSNLTIPASLEEVFKNTTIGNLKMDEAYYSDGQAALEDKDTLAHNDCGINEDIKQFLGNLLGLPFAIVSETNMTELSDNLTLPVIARNCLV